MLKDSGMEDFTDKKVSIIGTEAMYGNNSQQLNTREVLLRIIATHSQKEALVLLSREIAQGSTGMAPGFINILGPGIGFIKGVRCNISEMVIKNMKKAIELDVPIEIDCGFGPSWYEAH